MTLTQKIFVAAAITASSGIALYQTWQAGRMGQELRSLRESQGSLTQQLEKLTKEHAATVEAMGRAQRQLESAQKNEVELLRLRGQVGVLRNQAQSAPPKVSRTQPATASPTPEAELALPILQSQSLKTRGTMPNGHTMVVGGLAGTQGRRTMTFVTPVLKTEGPEKGQVVIQSKLIEATDEVWNQLGLSSLQGSTADAAKTGLFTPEGLQKLLQVMTDIKGVDVLSSPTITTLEGRQARISVGEPPAPGATNAPGISLDLLPKLASDGTSIDLDLELKTTSKVTPEKTTP